MPDLAAVAPLAGAADVIEVVEGVARPGAGDGGDQRALGLRVGQVGRVAEVLEIGQGARGDEIPGVAQVPLVDEVLGLVIVEHGHIRLRLALELGLVVAPLKPLDGIDVTARAPGGEDRGKSAAGSGSGGGRGGNGIRAERKGHADAAHGHETHDTAAQAHRAGTDH